MLLALLLDIPWWLALPGYFAIGTLWACIYLPRSIQVQAARYAKWRSKILGGVELSEALGPESTHSQKQKTKFMHPVDFMRMRDEHGLSTFTEGRIVFGFILNIAAWPVRIVQKILTDYLQVVWRWVSKFWKKVIVPAWNWVYARVSMTYQAIIKRANREAIADLQKLSPVEEVKQ